MLTGQWRTSGNVHPVGGVVSAGENAMVFVELIVEILLKIVCRKLKKQKTTQLRQG